MLEIIDLFPAETEQAHQICWACLAVVGGTLAFWAFVGWAVWSAFYG